MLSEIRILLSGKSIPCLHLVKATFYRLMKDVSPGVTQFRLSYTDADDLGYFLNNHQLDQGLKKPPLGINAFLLMDWMLDNNYIAESGGMAHKIFTIMFDLVELELTLTRKKV